MAVASVVASNPLKSCNVVPAPVHKRCNQDHAPPPSHQSTLFAQAHRVQAPLLLKPPGATWRPSPRTTDLPLLSRRLSLSSRSPLSSVQHLRRAQFAANLPPWPKFSVPSWLRPAPSSAPRWNACALRPNLDGLIEAMHVVSNDADERSRWELLAHYNGCYAPHLQTEEAVFKLWSMALVFIYLPIGAVLDLHIKRNVQGRRLVGRYARKMRHVAVTHNNVAGGAAHCFMPANPPSISLVPPQPMLVIFPGTSLRIPSDILLRRQPFGLRADLDPDAIGKRAFEANRSEWLRWVRGALARRQPIVLIGYSLGGVLAARLLAELEPAEQKQVQLLTFYAPGLDVETNARIEAGLGNIRLIQVEEDRIHRLGEVYPPGTVIVPRHRQRWDWLRPHRVAYFTRAELAGEPLAFDAFSADARRPVALYEQVRRILGRALHDHIPV